MVYKYLFLIENGGIKTYHNRETEFQLTKYQGNDIYDGDFSQFWSWWESTSSYIEGICTVDFCFLISDSNDEVNQLLEKVSKYNVVEDSTWDKKTIEEFLHRNSKFYKVIINYNDNVYEIYNNYYDTKCIDVSLVIYPNKKDIFCSNQKSVNENIDENNHDDLQESYIAKYYRNKTKELMNTDVKFERY